jgi:hypothetical protein
MPRLMRSSSGQGLTARECVRICGGNSTDIVSWQRQRNAPVARLWIRRQRVRLTEEVIQPPTHLRRANSPCYLFRSSKRKCRHRLSSKDTEIGRWSLPVSCGQTTTEQANPVGPALSFSEQIGTVLGWRVEVRMMVARDGISRHYTFPVTLPLTGIQLDPKRSGIGSAFSQ